MSKSYGCKVNRVLMVMAISFAIMYSVNYYLETLMSATPEQTIQLSEYSLELNDDRYNKAIREALNDDVIMSGEVDYLSALYKKIKLEKANENLRNQSNSIVRGDN